MRKSTDVIKTIEHELGLSHKKHTTDDMLFTLEQVACIGACGLAPVITVNEDVHGTMTSDKAIEIISEIKRKEAAGDA